jgi:hypothetical protein
VEFNLFNFGKSRGDWWLDLFVLKWKHWEPGLFKVHYSYGKWEWDFLGLGELVHWLKIGK